mgnify:CR=1 FL=1
MKYYTVNQDMVNVAGIMYDLNHSYMAPYERDDLYLSLIDEQTPQSPDSALEIDMGSKLYADVDYEYNYFTPKYQALTTAFHDSSLFSLLPSLNAWLLLGNEMIDGDIIEFMFTTYKTNGDLISPDRVLSKDYFRDRRKSLNYLATTTPNPSVGAPSMEGLGQIESNEYNSGVTEPEGSASGMDEPSTSTTLSAKYQNINRSSREILPGYERVEFINKEVAKLYADSDNKREMFPMFSKFKMTGIEKTEFCNLLEQYELDSEFIDFLVSTRNENKVNQPIDFKYFVNEEEKTLSSKVCLYRYEDFISHMEAASDKVISEPNEEQTVCEYFESFLKSQVFKAKAEEMIQNMPTGNAFPIAFRLEKQSDDGKLYSTHYFFNYTDLETFLFFDTQVAYRKEYVYDIRVINMVKVPVVTTSNFSGEATELIFIEEPYYKESIFILDSPPIAPDVELITYRGIDNKVLIMFNQMIDKKAQVPIYINPSDAEYFKDQHTAQKIELGLPIIFESDDPADFEFFRLNRKPVEYQEFSNENYKIIQAHDAYSAAYEDTVIPNQTYYYMFRTQDRNGFVSNPSPIYEFTLLKEGETLYPRIRIVDLAKPEPPAQKERTFKKYVKIGLSPRQYLLPKESMTNLEDSKGKHIDIGVSEDNILISRDSSEDKFRKFKFRIRSKNTGKLIDINVTFKKNKVIKA